MHGSRRARCDLVLVGGGLQNCLVALAVLRAQPHIQVVMVERSRTIGGNHTWCFHAGDVPASLASVVDAITAYRWDGYAVRFPGRERTLFEPYAGTCSSVLAAAVLDAFARAPHAALRLGVAARVVGPDHVELDDGTRLDGALVIDARGPDPAGDAYGTATGYQKFVGLELELERPHGLARPLLMDATVPQVGGFRFFYVLPLAADRVLVEDTTFARDPTLAADRLEQACLRYAAGAGLSPARVVRIERGVLPMPWRAARPWPSRPLVAGYRGGWFHPATGYSFPIAARLAAFVASRPPEHVVGAELDALWRAHQQQARFCHRLNGLMFRWFREGSEWHVVARFYRLPAAVIRRFYALETTELDRARILVGRPPRGLSLRTRLASRFAR